MLSKTSKNERAKRLVINSISSEDQTYFVVVGKEF